MRIQNVESAIRPTISAPRWHQQVYVKTYYRDVQKYYSQSAAKKGEADPLNDLSVENHMNLIVALHK